MRIPWQPFSASLLMSSALLSYTAHAMDCDIHFDSNKWNLQALGGVRVFQTFEDQGDVTLNTTWVMNICNILHRAATRGGHKCGTSKNICAFQTAEFNGTGTHEDVYPIVGYDHLGGGSKDIELGRLKNRENEDETQGLSVKMSGGGHYIPPKESTKKNTAAVFNFYCDRDRTGLEGLEDIDDDPPTSEDENAEKVKRVILTPDDNDDGNSDGAPGPGDRSLRFKGFKEEDGVYTLRLDWYTRYGCDDYVQTHPDGDDLTNGDGHWGFFAWLIILVFLGTAAYLIFKSWLNYNQYGARGWDLLPHGDTIRDIPYIFQDWLRRVVNTLQGPGSRGGYSAV